MIRLLRVETRRWWARRFTRWLIVAMFLGVAVAAGQAIWETRPHTAEEIATAQAQAEIENDAHAAELADCLADPDIAIRTGATAEDCERAFTTPYESLLPRHELDLAGTLRGNGIGAALIVMAGLMVIGVAFAGTDWRSGSMETQLTVEPRRRRVWVAKAVAVTVSSAVVSAVLLGAFWAAMYWFATERLLEPTQPVLTDVGWHLLRAVVIAAAAGLGSYAAAMVLRRTWLTLGLLFVWAVGTEVAAYLIGGANARAASVASNVVGWLQTRVEHVDQTLRCSRFHDCSYPDHIGWLQSGAVIGGLTLLAVVISLMHFSRRDVV